MNTYTTDRIKIEDGDDIITITRIDKELNVYDSVDLTYDEFKDIAKGYTYIEEMRKVTDNFR